MMLPSKAAEYSLLQKLASTLKLPKKDFIRTPLFVANTEEELPVYSYPVIAENNRNVIDPIFYSVSATKALNIHELVTPKKWCKSELRETFFQGQNYLDSSQEKLREDITARFVLSVAVVGMVWLITANPPRLPLHRNFQGGILVQDPFLGNLFSFQPVKNYLIEQLEIEEEEID